MPPTVKHLSYSGITIPLMTPQLETWLASVHPQASFLDFDGWNYATPEVEDLPTPSIPTPPAFQIGKLYWPTGAVRPAWFHFITTTDRLNAIKTAQGAYNTPQPLVLFDGRSGKTITSQMFMLPERPLNQLGHADSDAWLITLTDARFYWHWKKWTLQAAPSWLHLFLQISLGLGVPITVDTIDPAYGVPSSSWQISFAPLPVVLDAAASQIGQRVVVGLDGSVKTVNWETARAESTNQVFNIIDEPVISGGLTDNDGIARYVPSSIKVLFQDESPEATSDVPIVIDTTLISLSLTPYGSQTGVPGYFQTLNADIPFTGSNAAEVVAYAHAYSADWYGWRLSDTDLVWPGIEPWTPTGWEDSIEWTIQLRSAGTETGHEPFSSTMVRRGPWNDFQGGTWNRQPGVGSGSGRGCEDAVEAASVACEGGSQILTTRSLAVVTRNGVTSLETCNTTTQNLGACSPTGPETLPVSIKVCPTFTTLNYLDHSATPQTLEVMTAITVERRLITVPVAETMTGCVTNQDLCCGSGPGPIVAAQCVTTCTQCVEGMSDTWLIENPENINPDTGMMESGVLVRLIPSGNSCVFVSDDLVWEMKYDAASSLWTLQNYDTNQFWYREGNVWQCMNRNIFEPLDPLADPVLSATPLATCITCCPPDVIPINPVAATITVSQTLPDVSCEFEGTITIGSDELSPVEGTCEEGGGGFNQRQADSDSSTAEVSTPRMLNFPSNVVAGNLLIVAVSTYNPSITVTVSDTAGNSWTQIGGTHTGSDSSVRVSLWYAVANANGPCQVTVSPSGICWMAVAVGEWSGNDPTAPLLDFALGSTQTNPGFDTSWTTPVLDCVSPTTLLVSAFGHGANSTAGGSGGTTIVTQQTMGLTEMGLALAAKISSAPVSDQIIVTLTPGVNGPATVSGSFSPSP